MQSKQTWRDSYNNNNNCVCISINVVCLVAFRPATEDEGKYNGRWARYRVEVPNQRNCQYWAKCRESYLPICFQKCVEDDDD